MRAAAVPLDRLAARSVEVIRAGQAPTGAYLAAPTFAPYRYSWFRDGSFVAEAMSTVGEAESAEAFFRWGAEVVLARRRLVEAGEELHTRYTAGGNESAVEWPHFQLDGFGLFLWALARHDERHGQAEPATREAAELLRSYLARNWPRACTDWWEEQEGMHAVTLGCIAAGLRSVGDSVTATQVLETLATEADWRLDAGLIALATPLGVVPPEVVPLARIEHDLVTSVSATRRPRRRRAGSTTTRFGLRSSTPARSPGGGVHRHPHDTYYGGGEWLLLTALLGLHYLELGRAAEARAKLRWVAARATAEGELPELSHDHLLHPDALEPWVARWGPPPSPLLWSHAMFLLLASALGAEEEAA